MPSHQSSAERSQTAIDAAKAERTGRDPRSSTSAPTGFLLTLSAFATLCWLVALVASLNDGTNWAAAVCAVLFGAQTLMYGRRWRNDRRT